MFIRAIEYIFSGFKVDADTLLAKKLAATDEKMLVVKKSHHYITLDSLGIIFGIVCLVAINIGLFFLAPVLPQRLQITLTAVYGFNMLLRVWMCIAYLHIYTKNYAILTAMPAKERIPVLEKGDRLFRRFFNQTIFLLIGYFAIILGFIGGVARFGHTVNRQDLTSVGANILFFVLQFILSINFLQRFIDLEMDFVIVTNDDVRYYNQLKWGTETKSLDLDKIKTVKSSKIGFRGSLFNFGQVSIFTEGDEASQADMVLAHISNPEAIGQVLKDMQDKK